ncbi:MAG: cbb3-type cytochrome c oxidase subunit I, partial [Candidatus Hydrogenedentota bacterium]
MIRRYIFSTNHKMVGIQYGLAASFFLLTGFMLMLIMRWQLAYPGKPNPTLSWISDENIFMPGGIIGPDFYNSLGAMHGTIMVFLAVVPMLVGAFGNYIVPLQIGARDMAFPRLNMLSFWLYFVGGLIMLSSFLLADGPPNSGWTSYPPLSVFAADGQTLWLIGMAFLINSSLAGSVNMIATIIQLRAPGMTFFRMPFFVWSQLVAAFLLLLAFPPLEAAAVFQLSDRLLDTSFFLPSGLVLTGEIVERTGGGSPLLWQHLFWFLAHPEVYVLVLPAMGIVAEVITNNTRRPLWGYKVMALSTVFLGFFSCMIWAHHMYLTGMGTTINGIFEITTLTVSIPSLIIMTSLVATLWGASIRFTVPMLFALAFLPMFGIGGFTGLPLALATSDVH